MQTEVAGEVGLDVAEFSKSLEDGRAKAAFEADRAESERLEVRGFPTFTIGRGEVTARLNGWQPWEVFEEALRQVDPGIEGKRIDATVESVLDLLKGRGRWATREVAAVLGVTDDDAELLLEELEGDGRIQRRSVGNGLVWGLAPLAVPTLDRTAVDRLT